MKKKLPDTIAESIIQYILDCELTEGDKLPNENTLAAQLNVGRNTVREAMKVLASRNIVRIRQGSGMYVSGKTGVSEDPLGLMFINNKMKLMEDLMAIRFMVEPAIAGLAARNATQQDINTMQELCDEVSALIMAGKDFQEKDVALHTAIAMSSKNVVIPRLIPIIHSTIIMMIDVTKRVFEGEAIAAHKDIVQAIAEHDSIAAHDAMYTHLLPTRRLIRMQVRAMTPSE